jgi:TATA-binding protein-associated factor
VTFAVIRIEETFYRQQETKDNQEILRQKDLLPFLIVCPASLVLHWQYEITKFFPSFLLKPVLYKRNMNAEFQSDSQNASSNGTENDHAKQELYGSSTVLIASYESVRADTDSFFLRRAFEAVALDEAHVIKNPHSLTAQSIFQLKSNFRIALSGTPVQNNVQYLFFFFFSYNYLNCE